MLCWEGGLRLPHAITFTITEEKLRTLRDGGDPSLSSHPRTPHQRRKALHDAQWRGSFFLVPSHWPSLERNLDQPLAFPITLQLSLMTRPWFRRLVSALEFGMKISDVV